MLRGMGWEPGAPVGLSNPAVVEPHIITKRNDRLGLGATVLMSKKDRKLLEEGEGGGGGGEEEEEGGGGGGEGEEEG